MDNPKGAMVTTRSLTLATNVMYTIGYHLSDVDTILSFLPSISACLSLFSRCFFLYSSLNSFL